MNNETKRDVFLQLAKENRDLRIYDPDAIEPKQLIEQDHQDWIREYDAALPDDLPTIPEVVAKKKYLVELDGLVTTDGAKQYLTKKNGKWFASRRISGLHQDFTVKELNNAPEWAQRLDREEVIDDEQ